MSAADAVVIGAGHNGLVAANLLVDAGWDVVLVEATAHPGGAVRSDESVHPGFVTDLFSAFYPLGAASPVIRGLDLEAHGLRWAHAPVVLAHVFPDDRCAVISRDPAVTAASVEQFGPGDGAAWLRLLEEFERIQQPFLDALFGSFPPIRPGVRLLRSLGAAQALRFARFAVQPVRRFSDERFAGAGAGMLLAGNALHSDLAPEGAGSAIYGWILAMLGQTLGFPVPVGGSGRLADALVARFVSKGGSLRLGAPVDRIDLRGGVAVGVRLATGSTITARRAVLADVGAPTLYRDLVGLEHLPARLGADLDNFEWDQPTFKVNWALSAPIPWTAGSARGAGTVHLGVDLDGLTHYAADLATRRMPRQPFLLLGQMTTSDATRSPVGTESVWAYTHVPAGPPLTPEQVERHVELVEATIERNAPGFRALIMARSVQSPAELQALDANLVHGAVAGGTANLYQQLVFRPIPGLGGAQTPVDRLYLAGASAHPGGGVHGGPGANAARAALSRAGLTGAARRRALDAVLARVYR